jgi:hypothetical protein
MIARISGRLPRRNASRAEADRSLVISALTELASDEQGRSLYLDRAVQGATIAPRPFWFVEVSAETAASERRWVVTDREATRRAKKPWTGVRLDGQIEADFIFVTALEIFPFRLGSLKICALPIDIHEGKVSLLSPEQVLRRGAPGFHAWLVKSAEIWDQRKKDSAAQNVELYEYLDNHSNLTRQKPGGTGLAYGADGSHIRAAVIDTDAIAAHGGARAFILDMNMYWIRTKTPEEAHYLAAVLNTPYLDDAIKSGQTRGAWGARHIHRRPFEVVPIPEFNPLDDRHARLAELSVEAHALVAVHPRSRIYQQQLAQAAAAVAEADTLARQLCVAGKADGVLG